MRKLILLVLVLLLSACNFNTNQATPTVSNIEQPINPLPEVTDIPASATPSLTPSPTSTPEAVVQVITQVPTATPFPTETLLPSPTPGPWEYVIQEGDTLGYIIQISPHNYPYDPAVIEAVVRLNDNIINADSVPPPGSTILIPRPTVEVQEVAQAGDQTPVVGNAGPTQPPTRGRVSISGEIGCHTVREGESVVGIVQQYGGLTLEILSQLNADINFLGCNFEEPSGGPNCAPLISIGQCVNVPLPTPTITLSPTFDGNETATPTPTYRAPFAVSPPDDSIVSGTVTLYWDSAGILRDGEYYLVQVIDKTSNSIWAEITQNTSYRLPSELIPVDGQTHEIEWNISVARANAEGAYAPVGTQGTNHTFKWQSS